MGTIGIPPKALLVGLVLLFVNACGAEGSSSSESCGESGRELTGAAYDVALSRFAFGSAPVAEKANGSTRWQGKDGVLVIGALGNVLALPNADSSASNRPDWSADPDAMSARVREYFVAMGVPACQIERTTVLGSNSGRQISLSRAANGIVVAESHASARINDADQTTTEGFMWPALPASVIDEARQFRDELADPVKLDAYRSKLPAEAREDGRVVIHHSNGLQPGASVLRARVTWDTMVNRVSPRSFDRNGVAVEPSPW